MEKLVDTQELERELRATLSAQREIGPNYDHHLIDNFMRKVHQQPAIPPFNQAPPTPNTNATIGPRLALGILSLIFMVPLAAITTANSGLAALVVVGLVVLGINFAFNRSH